MDCNARNILVCLRYGIGDVVMELPALRALRAAVPEARITALGAPPATELLEPGTLVDRLVSIRRWGIRHRWHRGDADAPERIGRWLDRNDFDLYLDVHHAAPVLREVVWARGIRSLEADEQAEAAALASGADGVAAVRSAVRAGWGLEFAEAAAPRLEVAHEEARFAEGLLRSHGVRVRPIAVSPVASLQLKRWPVERFASVADRLAEEEDAPILLFMGPQEEVGQELLAHMRRPERVVPIRALHLRRVAALLARCRLLLCNDTGLMHMGAALQVPTLAVFGPTPPQVYRPPGAHVASVGGEAVECPHRNTGSLHPPGCWADDRCLIAERGCIEQAPAAAVLRRARQLLADSQLPEQAALLAASG